MRETGEPVCRVDLTTDTMASESNIVPLASKTITGARHIHVIVSLERDAGPLRVRSERLNNN